MDSLPSQEAVGHHQHPVNLSNSSWMTKVATPADLGLSRTLAEPGKGYTVSDTQPSFITAIFITR